MTLNPLVDISLRIYSQNLAIYHYHYKLPGVNTSCKHILRCTSIMGILDFDSASLNKLPLPIPIYEIVYEELDDARLSS